MNENPTFSPPPPGQPPRPPRQGRPWWVWVLGGCGGCAVLVLIGSIFAFMWVKNNFMDVQVGPIDKASIQQSLGDVPLYPNGNLEPMATGMMLKMFRGFEKMGGQQPGQLCKGVAAQVTSDSPDKVFAFYEKRLKETGWQQTQAATRNMNQEQRQYRKGNEVLLVQIQTQAQGTVLMLMRGGPGMAEKANQQRR